LNLDFQGPHTGNNSILNHWLEPQLNDNEALTPHTWFPKSAGNAACTSRRISSSNHVRLQPPHHVAESVELVLSLPAGGFPFGKKSVGQIGSGSYSNFKTIRAC